MGPDSKMLQALVLAEKMKWAAFDVCQAYLHAKRDRSEWIPTRYPEGPPRDRHRDPTTGEERFAILKGRFTRSSKSGGVRRGHSGHGSSQGGGED